MAKNIKKTGTVNSKKQDTKSNKNVEQTQSTKHVQKQSKQSEKKSSFINNLFSDFKFNLKNPKFKAIIPFIIFLLIFLFTWKDPEVLSMDPWYAAYQKIDSSMKVTDPALKQKLLEEGGTGLKELVKKYPFHAKVHLFLGVYFNITRQWDSAIYHHKETIRLGEGGTINPVEQDGAKQLLVAISNKTNELMNNNNDFVSAKKVVEDGLKFIKNNPDLLTMLGIMYHKQGRIDSAGFYYQKAIELNPELEFARNNYSLLNLQLANEESMRGNTEKALVLYKKAVELNPKNADALSNIGAIYTKMKKYPDAIKTFKAALDAQPGHPQATNGIIYAYTLSGDLKSAEQYKRR